MSPLLNDKPHHIPVKYRCKDKKSYHIRATYLNLFLDCIMNIKDVSVIFSSDNHVVPLCDEMLVPKILEVAEYWEPVVHCVQLLYHLC